MPSYQRLLAKNRISQSMSRKGNCLDNAAMESFFGRMKTECFHGKSFTGIDELEKVINDYVRYYNEERIQLKLKGLSPIQYRKQSLNNSLTFWGQIKLRAFCYFWFLSFALCSFSIIFTPIFTMTASDNALKSLNPWTICLRLKSFPLLRRVTVKNKWLPVISILPRRLPLSSFISSKVKKVFFF